MADDITDLIRAAHDDFRRSFADVESLQGSPELAPRWLELATKLEVHASAEEKLFFPELLKGVDDIEAETKDAIEDHNKIRDASRRTGDHEVGSAAWWQAVHDAREATVHHLDEEESDDLPPFRENVDLETRLRLGAEWVAFHERHRQARGLPGQDKDAERYVEEKSVG